MKKNILLSTALLLSLYASAQADSKAQFGATVYSQQAMADNVNPIYLVDWTKTSEGLQLTNDKASISEHLTTIQIDATAIPGNIQSISIYANKKEGIAGPMQYNGAAVSTPAGSSASVYASNGQSDVVMLKGSSKSCKAYLRPVALSGGVKVTVRTDDGKFYTQNFAESIAAGDNKSLTITETTANNLWMATIPGSTYFSFVSTPGAHDAATSGVSGLLSSSAKCQGEDIATLLANGVRAFDLRPGYYYNASITADNLYIYHGQMSTNVLYKDAIKTLVDFVKDNPTEAISIVMVKENCKPLLGSSWTDRSSEMWAVVNAVQEQYKSYMKTLDHSYYTLDDFRGKICYVNRTGTSVPYTTQIKNWPDNGTVTDYSCQVGLCNANIQDVYNYNGEKKQTAVKDMLQLSSANTSNKNMHYNFCSSATSPANYAKATNPVITTYLNEGNITGPTGYVYADFIGSSSNGGAALLTAIVDQNYRYVFTKSSKVIRTSTTGKYGTICLPFSASAIGADLFTATLSDDNLSVVITPLVGDMEAGMPYIYQATSSVQTFSDNGEQTVSTPTSADPLIGVFTPTPLPVGSYVMQTQEGVQQFYKVVDGDQPTLSAYRAYLSVPSTEAKALGISLTDETAIKALDALTSGSAQIFDLNGRKLNSLQKGVNIVNGVKVLVR